MSDIRKEKMGNATSIYNLMRNIGGSFGIATMTTFLARRSQVHQNQLISHITPYGHPHADARCAACRLVSACTRSQAPPTRRISRWERFT